MLDRGCWFSTSSDAAVKQTGHLNTSTGTVELRDGDANPSCGSGASPAAACLLFVVAANAAAA